MRRAILVVSILLLAIVVAMGGCAAGSVGPTAVTSPAPTVVPSATAVPSTPKPPTATPLAVKSAFPVTITDDTGRAVAVDREPKRVVSLAPSNTEILFALGLGPSVVGVTDFCDYPAEAKDKPKMGGIKPSLEKIVAAQPDLVLAIAETAGPPEIATKLEGLGIKVLVLGAKNIDGITADIQLVGKATGREAEAGKVVAQIIST